MRHEAPPPPTLLRLRVRPSRQTDSFSREPHVSRVYFKRHGVGFWRDDEKIKKLSAASPSSCHTIGRVVKTLSVKRFADALSRMWNPTNFSANT